MTTTPTPTGKIRGSLRDVMPKLRNFVGAVKVTTPAGKGGILFQMGRPVAAYLTQEGILHRGKASLDLLEKEQLAEFEILRYDDDQFREAMIICDNRGLLTGLEGGEAPATPSPAREGAPREENILSSMMKRFAAPKEPGKPEPLRVPPKAEPVKEPLPQAPKPKEAEPRPAGPRPILSDMKGPPIPEKKEAAAPSGETELSAIIRRLRESGRMEKVPAPLGEKAEEAPPVAAPPETGGKAGEPGTPVPVAEKVSVPAEPVVPAAGQVPASQKFQEIPGGIPPEGRVKVDLGMMMKRIKRLDITSIRREIQEGAEGGQEGAGGAPEGPSLPAGEAPAEAPAGAAGAAGAPESRAEGEGKSDIDELKAFIRRLEVLEETKEPPPREKGFLARLGVKSPAGESPEPREAREVPPPVPAKEKAKEEVPPPPEVKPVPVPPVAQESPRPAEQDRKAKITSILRKSGLVKPPVEEKPEELITGTPAVPVKPVRKEEPPAPAGEPGVPIPKPQRKKVEITRVPKMPEKPAREPPLLDERMIQKILKQPGVIAVSTFFEGFAVQSAGRADFDQVAANAEDLFRAGNKIAREIDLGPLNQIILETGKGKLIIAPHGDLNVCIFTQPDANLGLIRVAIRSMQVDTS